MCLTGENVVSARGHLSVDPATCRRFVREAKGASSIEHANICTIHEIDETPEGETAILMPRYRGELPSERIARGRLPLEEALHIVDNLADASRGRGGGTGDMGRPLGP